MQRFPIQRQQILSVSDDNLQALSKMADSIFEISKDDLVASVSVNYQSSDVNNFENRLAALKTDFRDWKFGVDHSREEALRFELLTNANIVAGILSLEIEQRNANSHALLNQKTSTAFRFGADGKKGLG
ncbi:hypothetical protein AVEN_137727-1 [Araneus ventricosus]|uniref:Uncharacterized protein n=1 Tax=Araneus ventricosus TaxID=182803 RepID=A0A4Y2UTN9_ARAVE|nr:hypothetical protein AVEN_137727-1 [Araneus ventricosus]